ncbi:MAG: hypothetical protein MJK04_20250 [Psychrosphaera sp.]|nr:hypothetical protein [Psychrosphaera sp.]
MDLNDSSLFDDSTNEYKHDTDAQLVKKITKLASHINAAAYQFLKMLAEFDRRQGWCQKGMRSCSQWLNWQCG